MNYNQTIATTTSFSPDGAVIGYTVRETTYSSITFILIFIMALSPLFFYKLFRRK